MSTQRRTVRNATVAGPKRRTKWIDRDLDTAVLNAGELIDNLDPLRKAESATLVREIIVLTLMPSIPSLVGTDAMRVYVGIGVSSVEAVLGGVVSDPASESEEPADGWVYKSKFVVNGPMGNDVPVIRVEKDIRAQRKIEQGLPFLVIQNVAMLGDPFTIHVSILLRMLYLLP